jgi:hypothetical protein
VNADEADDYQARQGKMDREYLVACREAGIEPDVSCRASSQNFAGDGSTVARGVEGYASVPCSIPPTETAPLTNEQILLRTIGAACVRCEGRPVEWYAFLKAGKFDLRSTAEIAASLKASQRSFQMHVKAAREWLAELRAEMEGNAVPIKGDHP